MIALALLMIQASCAAPVAQERVMATFANPVINLDFPDPATLVEPDGSTYVYATQGDDGAGRTLNIRVSRSTDLVNWSPIRDALPAKPSAIVPFPCCIRTILPGRRVPPLRPL